MLYYLFFIVIFSLPIIWLIWTIQTFRKRRKKLFYFQILVLLIIPVFILFQHLTFEKTKIFEDSLKIELPKDYELTKYFTDGYGPDFQIDIELTIPKNNVSDFAKKIEESGYFLSDKSKLDDYKKLKLNRDSKNKMGYWILIDDKYIYSEFTSNPELVNCEFDLSTGRIEFVFVHL